VKTLWKRLAQSSFIVKWTNWEFYPVYIANIPVVLFWIYFGFRSRSLFFFSTVNPVIETGGVLGESKINILNRLPENLIPKTLFIQKDDLHLAHILELMATAGIEFPVIVKPDIGERGFLVEKLESPQALRQYLMQNTIDLIVQEFIDLPVEISVLYYRQPGTTQGTVTSICLKKHLTVSGDGISTVEVLMRKYPRARFQIDRFRKNYPEVLQLVPLSGESIELEPIGNHCRGTTFLCGNHYIDNDLEQVFDAISTQVEGIYYGRFDIKCKSLELLKQNKGFKILEFNGVASEPAHIYDPKYSTLKAYKEIYKHWSIIYKLSKIQRGLGVRPMTWPEAFVSFRNYFRHMSQARH